MHASREGNLCPGAIGAGLRRAMSAAIAVLALAAVPTFGQAQAPVLTKKLFKVNGTAVTSAPAALTNGDILDWVITYRFLHNPAQPAQVDIRDLLSGTLQFVPGSLNAPLPFAKQWFDGSGWVNSEPATTTGVGAVVSFPQVLPSATGETFLLPVPPAAAVNTQGSGGDGYRAIPHSDGNVYVVNHHTFGTYLDCFVAASGLRCAGYPVHPPVTAGAPFNNNASDQDNYTPGKPVEYLDRNTGRLYFPVMKINGAGPPHDLGILCADLTTKASCGFFNLETYGTNYQNIAGIGGVGGRVYVQLHGGRIGCLDTTAAVPVPCAGQPYPVVTAYDFAQTGSSSEVVGSRIYSIWPSGAASFSFSCFDTNINAVCVGWGSNPKSIPGMIGILYPLLSANGTVTGICVRTTNGGSGISCYNPSTGVALTGVPPSYAAWVSTFGGGFFQTQGYGQSGFYQARVFNAVSSGGPAIGCYDFGTPTPGPCSGSWPVTGAAVTARHYATIADPERPGCMWTYGDDGKLVSFQAADGAACSATTGVDRIVSPANSYCAGGTVSDWGRLSVTGLTLGGGVTATLTLYDGNNPANLAVKSDGVTPYALNLPVTSLPLILSVGGLGIGYGTAPGQYKSLRVVFRLNGVSDHTPWTQMPPPSVEVTWSGGPPQICFRTRVVSCAGPVVTQQATALTKPALGPSINNAAPVPAFSAAHLPGPGCTASLKIKKEVPGAPSGLTGTFKFNVTCSTPGGLVQQQLSISWPGPATATLPSLPVGSTCTVSEDPTLPGLPAGYLWTGVPVSNPAGGVVTITKDGPNLVSFTNRLRPCDDNGRVMITKKLEGVPPGFTGTFTFNLACWSGTTLITKQAQIPVPGPGSATVGGIPTGSSCTVTEVPPLPALPAGWLWMTPTYLPASGQVDLAGNCCPEVVVKNRAKFCCGDWEGPKPDDDHEEPDFLP